MLDLINTILFWIFLWLLILQAYILLFNRGVPNIKTAKPNIKKMIDAIRKDIADKGNPNDYTICDLGAGNGRLTRLIARAIPNAHVIGYEIAPLSIFKCNVLKNLSGIKNLEYRREDFFKIDFSHINAIVFYLTLFEMGRLGEKLKETPDNTLIISNRFALKAGWTPSETLESNLPLQKQIFIYKDKPALDT